MDSEPIDMHLFMIIWDGFKLEISQVTRESIDRAFSLRPDPSRALFQLEQRTLVVGMIGSVR